MKSLIDSIKSSNTKTSKKFGKYTGIINIIIRS